MPFAKYKSDTPSGCRIRPPPPLTAEHPHRRLPQRKRGRHPRHSAARLPRAPRLRDMARPVPSAKPFERLPERSHQRQADKTHWRCGLLWWQSGTLIWNRFIGYRGSPETAVLDGVGKVVRADEVCPGCGWRMIAQQAVIFGTEFAHPGACSRLYDRTGWIESKPHRNDSISLRAPITSGRSVIPDQGSKNSNLCRARHSLFGTSRTFQSVTILFNNGKYFITLSGEIASS